ncbi:hypothetical protein E2562_011636 [Oryza meyeriana var. granulata]|uniref:Protein kinase domain-containing protein n=1 Tax=Oryza meyeriana var. granulata TaxID=110450 RepID=A0A6G1DWG6_9ORYZ|nr:hypothetical protein E2562_011636 [Oryza meyeriana var. granulata]
MAIAVSGRWTRLRTLGRGASGAVVSLAEDGASGELFAVKTAGAAEAAMLRRERGMMSGLSSPHVVPCIGGGDGPDGSYNLFLEFAPGGSLADEVARNGGRLEEPAIRSGCTRRMSCAGWRTSTGGRSCTGMSRRGT